MTVYILPEKGWKGVVPVVLNPKPGAEFGGLALGDYVQSCCALMIDPRSYQPRFGESERRAYLGTLNALPSSLIDRAQRQLPWTAIRPAEPHSPRFHATWVKDQVETLPDCVGYLPPR
jgi:hypothetical protein